MENYTSKTEAHIKSLTLENRKKLGQYMTPQFLGQKMSQQFTFSENKTYEVLDLAVGTGELLLAFKKVHPTVAVNFAGWDIDPPMLKIFQENLPEATALNQSLYETIPEDKLGFYDKIIGNPPYFEIKKNDNRLANVKFETAEEKGRLNVYALFFEYALKLLKPGGELVFLVPPSMNNGAYFSLTREHILKNSYIKHLNVLRDNNHFADALTSTQIIHLVKTDEGYDKNFKRSKKFIFDFNNVVKSSPKKLPIIFTSDRKNMVKAWKGRKNLFELGFSVKTGTTVWNLRKEYFDVNNNQNAPLLYSKDISPKNVLALSMKLNDKRYLPKTLPGCQSNPSIIVNRIVGSLNNPQIRFALVELPSYFTENHLNVISSTNLKELKRLAKKFKENSSWLPEYLKALTGNTQISATELQYLIPF